MELMVVLCVDDVHACSSWHAWSFYISFLILNPSTQRMHEGLSTTP